MSNTQVNVAQKIHHCNYVTSAWNSGGGGGGVIINTQEQICWLKFANKATGEISENFSLVKNTHYKFPHNIQIPIGLHVLYNSSGFADTYKVYIQSTLEGLVKQVHSKLQAYCSEDVTAKPKFYHLSKRLALSEKVNSLHCISIILPHHLYINYVEMVLNSVFPYSQEHDALSFIFMQNVGVRFGKVIRILK